MTLWRRVCIRLQQMANEHPEDFKYYSDAYTIVVLANYEEIYDARYAS